MGTPSEDLTHRTLDDDEAGNFYQEEFDMHDSSGLETPGPVNSERIAVLLDEYFNPESEDLRPTIEIELMARFTEIAEKGEEAVAIMRSALKSAFYQHMSYADLEEILSELPEKEEPIKDTQASPNDVQVAA